MAKICAVIPTFGLKKGTAKTAAVLSHLTRLRQTLRKMGPGNRMLIVNDTPGPINHTSRLLADLGYEELIEVRAPVGHGIGFCRFYGAQKAFQQTDAGLVVIMNDMSVFHQPEFAQDIDRHYSQHSWDMAVAARPGRSFSMENYSLPMLATETKINFRAAAIFDLFHLFPENYPDLVTGLSAISRQGMEGFDHAVRSLGLDVLEMLSALRFGYDTFVTTLFHLLGFKVGAVPFDPPPYFKDPGNKEGEHVDPKQFEVRENHYIQHELAIRKLLEINSRHKLAEVNTSYPSLALLQTVPPGAVYNIEARMRQEGMSEFRRALPPGFYNRTLSVELETSQSQNPSLRKETDGHETVTVWEVMEKLNITRHVLLIYESLRFFRSAPGTEELRKIGTPELAGTEGLAPSTGIIRELSEIFQRLTADPAVASALYAGIFVHDIGKFISQTDHFENSFLMIKTFAPLREVLSRDLSSEQLELVELIARYHSLYTDTMIAKERDILKPYEVTLAPSLSKEKQLLLNDILYAIAILDTHSVPLGGSRLSNDRLKELAKLHGNIRKAIVAGKPLAKLKTNSAKVHRKWGKDRFNSWVLGVSDIVNGKAESSVAEAEKELGNLVTDLDDFYLVIGRIKYCGLIFDLRKELKSPAQRARLLAWLYFYAKDNGADRFEFKLQREKLRWVGPQVEAVRSALGGKFDPAQITAVMNPVKSRDNLVEFIFKP